MSAPIQRHNINTVEQLEEPSRNRRRTACGRRRPWPEHHTLPHRKRLYLSAWKAEVLVSCSQFSLATGLAESLPQKRSPPSNGAETAPSTWELCTAQTTFQNLIKSRPTVKTVSRKVSLDSDWLRPMRHHGHQRFPHWLRGQSICSSFVCWHWSFESCRAQALQMGTVAVTTANKMRNKVNCFLAKHTQTPRVVLHARMRYPSDVRCARRRCASALKHCDLAAAL